MGSQRNGGENRQTSFPGRRDYTRVHPLRSLMVGESSGNPVTGKVTVAHSHSPRIPFRRTCPIRRFGYTAPILSRCAAHSVRNQVHGRHNRRRQMSGTKSSAALPTRTDHKVYTVWMATVWVAMLGGFGLDFARYLHESPPPPVLLNVHAAVYVTWLVLVSVQILLIEGGNVRLHMRMGWATAIVSGVMVPLGLAAALVDQARQVSHPDYAPQFLALEFEEMFAFSTFIIAGLLTRKNLAEHKRWMILSAVAISDAGFARIWLMGIHYTLPGPFGWWLQYFWGI